MNRQLLFSILLFFSLMFLIVFSLSPKGIEASYNQTSVAQTNHINPDAATAEGLTLPALQSENSLLAAGDVLQSWNMPIDLNGWGITNNAQQLWVSSPSAGWGGNSQLYSFTKTGTQWGSPHPYTWNPVNGPADATYNWHTNRIWVMAVGGTNCIHELDTIIGVTGNEICPGFASSQRGLTYDPVSNSYYAGGWNEQTIYQFNASGTIMRNVNVGLSIAGLAYNPTTEHLFVMVNDGPTAIYVFDAAVPSLPLLSSFPVPALPTYSGAGLSLDCSGNLWAVDIVNKKVNLIESGETTNVCPQLSYSATPLEVTLAADETAVRNLTLTNNSSVPLNYQLTDMEIHRPGLPPLLRSLGDETFTDTAPVGPMSVLSTDGQALFTDSLLAPDAWFNGIAPPAGAGVIRYGAAQCAGQPNSYYLVSGVNSGLATTSQVIRYDTHLDSWTSLAAIPTAQEGPTAVCYGGYIYALGGGGTNQFYIYNIATNTWSAGPALPRNVWGAAAAAYDGKIYLIGGDNNFSFGDNSNEVNIYDIATGIWSNGQTMPVPATVAGYAQVGPYVYLAGGWGNGSPAANVTDMQRYNIISDSWELIVHGFPSGRADFSLIATETHLYALGGDANGGGGFNATDLVESYDYRTWPAVSWQDANDPLPTPVTTIRGSLCTTAFDGNQIWRAGGMDSAYVVQANTLYRPIAESCLGPGNDAVWVAQSPSSGTINPNSSVTIYVIFDATEVDSPGTYVGEIFFSSSALTQPAPLPVVLNVTWTAYLPFVVRP